MIYEEIIKNVPSGLSKLEIARYLYLTCGDLFCFSTKLNNTDSYTHFQILNEKIDPRSFESIQVNCYTWSQFYSSLLNEFEIKNEIVKCWHSFVNFFIDDVRWVADITYGRYSDLSRIQYGDKTNMFGPTLYDSSSNTVTNDNSFYNILNDIDIKLGFDKKSKLLKFKELLYSVKENSIHKYISYDDDIVVSKLKYIFSNIGCLSFGYYEAKEFVFELEKILLNDNELKKVSSIELIRNNSINEIDILQCICVKSGSGFVYFILCPNLPINQIYSDDFSSLFNLGFKPKSYICGISQYDVPNDSKNFSIYDFIQAKTKKPG